MIFKNTILKFGDHIARQQNHKMMGELNDDGMKANDDDINVHDDNITSKDDYIQIRIGNFNCGPFGVPQQVINFFVSLFWADSRTKKKDPNTDDAHMKVHVGSSTSCLLYIVCL